VFPFVCWVGGRGGGRGPASGGAGSRGGAEAGGGKRGTGFQKKSAICFAGPTSGDPAGGGLLFPPRPFSLARDLGPGAAQLGPTGKAASGQRALKGDLFAGRGFATAGGAAGGELSRGGPRTAGRTISGRGGATSLSDGRGGGERPADSERAFSRRGSPGSDSPPPVSTDRAESFLGRTDWGNVG